jgi:hypothetical protein
MRLTGSIAFFTALLVALSSTSSWALDEIYSPNVEQGEVSLEYNGSRTFDHDSGKNNEQEHELALEYGVNSRWEVEASAGFEKEPDASVQLQDYEIENRFQFFEQGANWLDSGLLVAFDDGTHHTDSDNLEVKLLLQKDIGRFSNTANIGFDQAVGKNSTSTGGPDYVFLWSTRYRYSELAQPGFEIQSDLGQHAELQHFDEQEHYVGPALYGRLFGNVHYETAYLFGVTTASAQSAARVLLEYEMHF